MGQGNLDFSFTTYDEIGNEVRCDALAVLNTEDSPVVVYTDYTKDNEDKYNLYASKITKGEYGMELERIDDVNILPEIRNTMEKIWDGQENNIDIYKGY